MNTPSTKKSHKRLALLCSVLCLVMLITMLCTGCSTPKNDEGFIKNLAAGLNARWKISEELDTKENITSSEYESMLEQCVNSELKAIGDIDEYEFEDSELKEQATAYYSALETQLEGLKYYGNNDEKYAEFFEGSRQDRAQLIYQISQNYDIGVASKYAGSLEDMQVEGQTLEELDAGLEQYAQSLADMELEKTTSTMYAGTITNLSEIVPDSVTINITGYNESGGIAGTASAYLQDWQTGNTQTVEFWSSNANFASATGKIEFWYNNEMRQTEEVPLTIVDNMKINIEMPDFPVESMHIGYDDKVKTRCLVNDATYTIGNWMDGKASSIQLQLSGEKIFDIEGDDISQFCLIGWKLYDSDNAVVDSGTLYTVDLKVGERFLNSSTYIQAALEPGDYRLEILNVED